MSCPIHSRPLCRLAPSRRAPFRAQLGDVPVSVINSGSFTKSRSASTKTPMYVPIGTFVALGTSASITASGTVQIVDGTPGCSGDSASANFVLLTGDGSAILEEGPASVTSRPKDPSCTTPMSPRTRRSRLATAVVGFDWNFMDNLTGVVPGNSYMVAIKLIPTTDDTVQLYWNQVLINQYVTSVPLAIIPAGSHLPGHRMTQTKYYVLIASLVAAGAGLGVFGGGRIEIGGGSGKDEMWARFQIKEGQAQTGYTSGSLPTVYEAPQSGKAQRDTDQVFYSASSPNSFAATVPGRLYSIVIELDIQTDDTVRVYWTDLKVVTL